ASMGAGSGSFFQVGGLRGGSGVGGVKKAAASFALDKVAVFPGAGFLVRVGQNAHAAAAALFVHSLSARAAPIAVCNARIKILQLVGNLRGDFLPFGESGIEFGFLRGALRFNLLSLGGEGNF